MSIAAGTKLGPYEVTGPIGAGGMGEVYRAHDPKLGRDVAIKVLPEAFARDSDRMARFQREAKVLASLSHPNIATIYGLEDSGATRALVMELVEGPTLADRIKVGPIPVDESLRIARQIADALEYAHERGIIHRDLKPANVKVTNDDAVKVLDFGLAKALEADPSSIDISTSPTISRMATMQGVLLGTAAYMAPEQAKAKTVDRRADIWAFGCVLYEMLSGGMAFHGETVADTLAAVIRAEPDWSQLPATTPVRVRVLLQRCLQKDPKQRLRDIGDARISLDEIIAGVPEPAAAVPTTFPAKHWPLWLAWGVATVFILAFSALAVVHFREKPNPAATVQRFEITTPDPSVGSVGVLSPDGTRWVMGAGGGDSPPSGMWLRSMDSLEARPLGGAEHAIGIPFWSPDSRFVVFGTTDSKLEKIDTTEGGPPQVLCDASIPVISGFWTPDGKIIFGDPGRQPGLWEVPSAGGVPSPLRELEPAGILPVPLPDGKHFLYFSGSTMSGDVYVRSLDSKPGQRGSVKLLAGILPGLAYAPSPEDPNLGYLLFIRGAAPSDLAGTLMAQPFDLRKLDLAGEPIPIARPVSRAHFSASLTGTLVYSSDVGGISQLALFDRQGTVLGTAGERGYYAAMAFSPDGKRVAASRGTPAGNVNLWIADLARGVDTRFTFDSGSDDQPVWSPDGNRIAFRSNRSGSYEVYQKLSNGGSEDELLFESQGAPGPLSWSRDGRFLLYLTGSPTEATVSVLPLDAQGHAAGKPFSFAQKGVGIGERFSPGPQGRPLWVAYSSPESGRSEIYVRPFDPNSPTGTPPGSGKWQVSTQGGLSPRWNGNGKELFYIAPDGTVMSVEVNGSGSVFQSGTPKPLFKPKGFNLALGGIAAYWDASSDGKKFIFAVSSSESGSAPPTRFTVVLNWPSLMKK